MKRFLEFTVSTALEGRGEELKEYSIGVAAFDKADDFDPRIDPIVRVEAGRLRTKLKEYYDTAGREDSVLIRFQKRSYVPLFELRTPDTNTSGVNSAPEPRAALLVEGNVAVTETALDSIAVLPFSDLSPRQDQEYFCVGITEELINVLSRIEGLNVTARTTVMQFKDKVGDVRAIGQQLNVHAVLEGSVRTDRRQVRISTQLINVADGYNLWADVYSREMSGIFEVQQSIADSIARALRFRLNEQTFSNNKTRDFQAYKLYLQGRFHWGKRDPQSLRRAIKYFEKAIERDSNYALAHSGMADTYASLAWIGTLAPEVAWERSRQFADRALELDPASAQTLNSQGAIRAAFNWDWAGAEASFRRAIELDPSYGPARHWNAIFCLAPQGRLDEAEQELLLARDLDPLAPTVHMHLGWIFYCRGQWESALENYENCLELDKEHYLAHCLSGFAHLSQGTPDQALTEFQAALALQKHDPMAIGGAGRSHAVLGDATAAKECLRKLKTLRRKAYVPETDIANIHIGAGELDTAFEWLERGVEHRCSRLIGLKVDPVYGALRNAPRFADLLARMGLAE